MRYGGYASLQGSVHAVASSLVCLSREDAGGPGPRLESWAYAIDRTGLAVLIDAHTYDIRCGRVTVPSNNR